MFLSQSVSSGYTHRVDNDRASYWGHSEKSNTEKEICLKAYKLWTSVGSGYVCVMMKT